MKWNWILFISWITLVAAVAAQAAEFSLASPQIQPGRSLEHEQLLNGFGCQGENISPALHWKNSPENAESYAVTLYDPDAPTGSGWWHWVIFNIPAQATGLVENAGSQQFDLAPIGSVQSRTDFGTSGYGGACPPEGGGEHRYIFSVYALDTKKLELDEDASAAMVGFFVRQHCIAEAHLTVLYGR